MISRQTYDVLTPLGRGIYGTLPHVTGLSDSDVERVARAFRAEVAARLEDQGRTLDKADLADRLATCVREAVRNVGFSADVRDRKVMHRLAAHAPAMVDALMTPEVAAGVRFNVVLDQAKRDAFGDGESGIKPVLGAELRTAYGYPLFVGVDGPNGDDPARDFRSSDGDVVLRSIGDQIAALQEVPELTDTERLGTLATLRGRGRLPSGPPESHIRFGLRTLTEVMQGVVYKRVDTPEDPLSARQILRRMTPIALALFRPEYASEVTATVRDVTRRTLIRYDDHVSSLLDYLDGQRITAAGVPGMRADERPQADYLLVMPGTPEEVSIALGREAAARTKVQLFRHSDFGAKVVVSTLDEPVTVRDPSGDTATGWVLPMDAEAFERLWVPAGDSRVILWDSLHGTGSVTKHGSRGTDTVVELSPAFRPGAPTQLAAPVLT